MKIQRFVLLQILWALCFTVLAHGAMPVNPSYVSSSGSGSSCTLGSPCALSYANTNAAAGDTIYLRGGTYNISAGNSAINPTNSGTAGNLISFLSYGSEDVNFVATGTNACAVNMMAAQSYIKISGSDGHNIVFTSFDKQLNIGLFSGANNTGGSHNEIAYVTFTGYYNATAVENWYRGSKIRDGATYNHVHHCKFLNYGVLVDDYAHGVNFAIGIEATAVETTKYNVIEYCEFARGGHHALDLNGSQNVVRNNYVHNEAWLDYLGTLTSDRVAFTIGAFPYTGRNLFENNRLAYGDTNADADQVGGEGIALCSAYNIFRHNAFYKNGLQAIAFRSYSDPAEGSSQYNLIYNNTFWSNGISTTAQEKPNYQNLYSHAIVIDTNGGNTNTRYNIVKNNLFWGNSNYYGATEPVIATDGSNAAIYSTFYTNTVTNNFKQTSDPSFVSITGTPDPTNETQFNLSLQAGSSAIDGGTYLTTATRTDNNTLAFADADYFFDGWTMVANIPTATLSADWVCFSTSSTVADLDVCKQVESINYTTDAVTITGHGLLAATTYYVWLHKNSRGEVVLAGNAPDYGAYEYGLNDTTDPTISALSPSGAQSCTSDPRNVTESMTTSEAATCRAHDSETTWAGMGAESEMTTTGGTSHSRTVSRACGASYSPNVLCQDAAENESDMGEWAYSVAPIMRSRGARFKINSN